MINGCLTLWSISQKFNIKAYQHFYLKRPHFFFKLNKSKFENVHTFKKSAITFAQGCTSSTSMSLSSPSPPARLASCWLSGLSDIFLLFWRFIGCVCFVGFSWLLYCSLLAVVGDNGAVVVWLFCNQIGLFITVVLKSQRRGTQMINKLLPICGISRCWLLVLVVIW